MDWTKPNVGGNYRDPETQAVAKWREMSTAKWCEMSAMHCQIAREVSQYAGFIYRRNRNRK